MKSTFVGLVLAALFLTAIFAVPHFLPNTVQSQTAEEAATVQAGFVGTKRIGDWTLVCQQTPPASKKVAPIPFSLSAHPRVVPPPAQQIALLGRCRAALLIGRKADPQQIVLVANFRLTGPARQVTMILRFAPQAKKGDWVQVQSSGRAFRLPVIACSQQDCIAGAKIAGNAEALLLQAPMATLILPPQTQHEAIGLPLAGLSDAISAMRRAQT